MEFQLNEFLHPRITKYCLKLVEDGHYQHAALESMKQVEIALREKGLAPSNKFGKQLVNWVLGSGEHITLRVPLGGNLQDQARLLFKGAFVYYRNYAAHDGANIDKKSSIRILMLASELLDLVDASRRSFERIGGIQGLIREGIFSNERELGSLLRFLNGRTVIEHDFGAHLEHLNEKGFDEIQQEAVFDLGFVKYEETEAVTDRPNEFTLVGYIELTDQGYEVLDELDDS